MRTRQQQDDVPSRYLKGVIKALTGTRAMGPAARMRDGYLPYSQELDFRTTDVEAARYVVEWASEQFAGAEIQLVESSSVTGYLTMFARVDLPRLAVHLADLAFRHATGQGFDPATDPLAAMIQRGVDETVAAGSSWSALVARLQSQAATLSLVVGTLEQGKIPVPQKG